jgi:alpha-tubulin suppressor-like RCC1 family protein
MQIRLLIIGLVVAVAACGGDSTGPDGLAPAAALSIADLPDTLLTRQTFRLTASATDDDGAILPDRPLAWASSDPDVVSITTGGVLTALVPGVATISVSTGTVTDSATVVVRALAFAHVFAGDAVSCGLEATGEAWCWGNVGAEGYGSGSADTSRQNVPLRAARGFAFSSLTLANGGACGVGLTGTVACWGQNDSAQVGDGTTTPRMAPVEVAGLSNIVQLVAGAFHFCARSGDGAVSCWGSNEWKQAGQATRAPVTLPRVVPLAGPASDLTTGYQHTCALVSGVNYCWGADYSRQLGNDTTYDRLVPVLAATGDGEARTWSEVEASNQHTCGRTVTGETYCWGILEGQGDNDTLAWLPMRRFADLVATDMAGGWFVQCAVSTQQEAWCDGKTFPRVKLSWDAPVTSVAVAGLLACVLDTAGRVGCESQVTERGQLAAIALPTAAERIVANDDQIYALDNAGQVFSWLPYNPSPKAIFDTIAVAGVYASSGARVCVLSEADDVVCRSGDYNALESVEPTGGLTFTSLAVGDDHTCGLRSSGAAWCWGANSHGQLGDGTTTDRTAPVEVQGGHTFTQLTAGWGHTCGRTSAGEIWCWGNGSWGSMGDDHRDESAVPVSVDGAPVLSGVSADCGLDGSGSVWCWPTSFSIPSAHQISGTAGLATIAGPCGLRATGEMLCWGSNYSGRFGNGTYNNTYTTAVVGGNGIMFKEISSGTNGRACGIGLDGATYCWGNGYATVPEKMIGSP